MVETKTTKCKVVKMSDSNPSKNIVDIESIALAASRNMTLAEVGVEETEKNKQLFRQLRAEYDKMYKSGLDANVAF
jgi:hypothetical protein